MKKIINITSRKNLEIYMNVQRQNILRILEINSAPMTPKQISEKIGISASSVTYHIKKLLKLGIIELDHQEIIHGIYASFYRYVPCIINLCGNSQNDLKREKMAYADYAIQETWKGFKNYIDGIDNVDETKHIIGDFMNGIFYLEDSEIIELKKILRDFQAAHLKPDITSKPWDIAIVAYPISLNTACK